jgi:diguanylate cyclase (GGDEF)-like protein
VAPAATDPAAPPARPLWLLFLTAGVLGLVSLAVPHDPVTDDRALVGISLAALAVGGGVAVRRGPLPGLLLHLALVTGTLLTTAAILVTGGPPNASSALYFWIGLYGAYVLPVRWALAHAGLAAAAYGLTCIVAPPPFPPVAHWTTTVGSLAGATLIVALLRRQLAATITELEVTARTDALTGLANRRAFNEALGRELARAARGDVPTALIACDIDRFKAINDAHGHEVGDRVLAEVAEVLRGLSRASDLVARTGGEEFCVVVPDSDAVEAGLVAERLRLELARRTRRGGLPVTASFGVAATRTLDAASLLREADRALYQAKADGRDRVVVAGGAPGQLRLADQPG